jgi:hypothetical protein
MTTTPRILQLLKDLQTNPSKLSQDDIKELVNYSCQNLISGDNAGLLADPVLRQQVKDYLALQGAGTFQEQVKVGTRNMSVALVGLVVGGVPILIGFAIFCWLLSGGLSRMLGH